MRVLVTGGAGFIGSHLVRSLLERGDEVVVLDDLSTGKRENLPSAAGLRLMVGDVADPEATGAALEGCDAFAHLAAVASVERSVREPSATNRVNLRGSIELFDAAAKHAVRRGVYASSAAVYGDNESLPLKESEQPRPLTPYAIDKLAGEQYLSYYHRSGALNATTFRFFNVFGPRQDPSSPYSGVISIFLDRARRGAPITVFGDGLQTRDFVYVGDVVAALVAALDRPGNEAAMPIYNVGRGEGVSLLDLLAAVGELPTAQSPLTVAHAAARVGDIRHSLADPSLLKERLRWQPRTSLLEGLTATAAG